MTRVQGQGQVTGTVDGEPAVERVRRSHEHRWGAPTLVARAPGRVNLIGEHTDYNDGFALPMALPFDTAVALDTDGPPARVEVDAAEYGFAVLDPPADPRTAPLWARHIAGVVALARERGVEVGGRRLTIATDVPVGAGLSSSAALEVAVLTALLAADGIDWTPLDVALAGQRVEHEVVGVPSGIMDQLISAGAVAGHAGLLDCRTTTLTPVPLPAHVVVAVMDTGTRRTLADGAYADRRAACERAAAAIGVTALRDATVDQLALVTDERDRARARHVVTENERVLAAVAAIAAGEAATFGALMTASHASLRDDFEVSAPALDAIVAAAHDAPGCLGARMTGGGFAGCAVALVQRADAARFAAVVESASGPSATVWICEPAAGAGWTY